MLVPYDLAVYYHALQNASLFVLLIQHFDICP